MLHTAAGNLTTQVIVISRPVPHVLEIITAIRLQIGGRVLRQSGPQSLIDNPVRIINRHVSSAIAMLFKKRAQAISFLNGVALFQHRKAKQLAELLKVLQNSFSVQDVLLVD